MHWRWMGKWPHVISTSDKYWDPTPLDCEGNLENETCFDAQSFFLVGPNNKNVDEVGNQTYFFDVKSYEELNLDEVIETFISF